MKIEYEEITKKKYSRNELNYKLVINEIYGFKTTELYYDISGIYLKN